MAECLNSALAVHEDRVYFQEAVLFTARATGLSAALVEKDYFCSLLLAYVFRDIETPVVFRGGTALAKIHADFYRLSEDLDCVIPTPIRATRRERSRRIEPFKEHLDRMVSQSVVFRWLDQLRGHNYSTQYIGHLGYTPTAYMAAEPAHIKIEIGLREELLNPPVSEQARTLLMDPFRKGPVVPNIKVKTLVRKEAYAEKLRAALTRRETAIRDFYDIDYAVLNLGLTLNDPVLEDYVLKKLKVPFNDPVDISPSRKSDLQSQLETQLKPVLRPRDYERFDLDRAFDLVAAIGLKIQKDL